MDRVVRSRRAWIGVLVTVVAEVLSNGGGIAITVLTDDKLDPVPLVLALVGVSTVVGLLLTVLPKGEPEAATTPSARRRPRTLPVVSVAMVILLLCGAGGVGVTYVVQKGFQAFCQAAELPACAAATSAQNVAISASATGPAPWVVEGHGVRFEVASTRRTSSKWMGATKPSITITAYVTRTAKADYKSMSYRISDQSSDAALESVPFGGATGDGDPPFGQRSKLVFVVWDSPGRAGRLTFTLHDFYWPDGRDLILSDVRVPSPAA